MLTFANYVTDQSAPRPNIEAIDKNQVPYAQQRYCSVLAAPSARAKCLSKIIVTYGFVPASTSVNDSVVVKGLERSKRKR